MRCLVVFLVSISWAGLVAADTPTQKLAAVDDIGATFKQTLSDISGQVLEVSYGRLLLKKPWFRWEVTEPFPQTIVAVDGVVKIFDPDLEQLSIHSLGLEEYDLPLIVLTRPFDEVQDKFSVQHRRDGEFDVVELTPETPEALFAQLSFVFQGEFLHAFTIVGHGGQTTDVELITYQTGLMLQSEQFELEVPAGTDIVEG
ncbi:MAG: outer membrane lipoprotein carrier protein LolA [Pseudomonadota bacterium]